MEGILLKKIFTCLCLCILCLSLCGCESQEMKDAKQLYDKEVERIKSEEEKLDKTIEDAQNYISKGYTPLDENKISTLEEAIKEAKKSKKEIPNCPNEVDKINETVKNDLSLIEYKTITENIQTKEKELKDSVKQFKQLSNPTSDFVLDRLKDVTLITGMSAITEQTDPYGDLNKEKSYSGMVYFTSSLVDQNQVYIDEYDSYGDIYVDKGTDGGGCVEIFTTVEDAKRRNEYVGSFDGTILSGGKHVVVGTLVVRTSNLLTATQQSELETAVIDALSKLE